MALSADDLRTRWPAVRPFLLIAGACIVAGGVVAAVTRPTGFGYGPWVAAYLVLVPGVAQIALGAGQAWLSAPVPDVALLRWELVAWNVGAACVIAGTLLAAPALTTLGGLVSVAALALFLLGVRDTGPAPSWARLVYRTVAVIVLVSIPVGLVLAWLRHS
jgi:hypothetical protein